MEHTPADDDARRSRGWHIALWAAQILLALSFGAAGAMKLAAPIEQLSEHMSWVPRVSPALVRFVGASELLGALGLVVPAATRIVPVLTPAAATGLLIVMVLAAGHHFAHDEAALVPVNVGLGALAAFIAWGRTRAARIARRS